MILYMGINMTIALITLIGNSNYGNRLQNYAAYHLLSNYGQTETLAFYNMADWKRIVLDILYYGFHAKISHKKIVKLTNTEYVRIERFNEFTKKYIPTRTVKIFNRNSFNKLNGQYDYFVSGSDQVWNPFFWGEWENEYFDWYFLNFVKPEKRIALSASIGISEIPEKWNKRFSDGWNKFKNISVREQEGAAIIKSLCRKEVEVLLDPTMALAKEEWAEIATPKETCKLPIHYAAVCFLGTVPKEYKNFITDIVKKRDLDLVVLNNPAYDKYFSFGPAEFLSTIQNAEIVFTDSFHAVVFSILFERPFIAFRRMEKNLCDMWSRMETLFQKLGIRNRTFETFKKEKIFECNYDDIQPRLDKEREKIFFYLNCLNNL